MILNRDTPVGINAGKGEGSAITSEVLLYRCVIVRAIMDGLDVDIENSCRAGSCGSCKVKLLRGDVDMEVDDGLEPEDRVSGYILACQAIPKTDVEVEA